MFLHLSVILFGGLCKRGSLSRGVRWGRGAVSVKGDLCPEGSLSRGVSVQGVGLCPGGGSLSSW